MDPVKISCHTEIYIFVVLAWNKHFNEDVLFNKEIKNASECIVELYKHAGIFKNTREVHREARGAAECFSYFSSLIYNSIKHA